MKLISRIMVGSFLAASTLADDPEAKLPVDENIFLKMPVDFSPDGEKRLDSKLLQQPQKPYSLHKETHPALETAECSGWYLYNRTMSSIYQ